jgi:hypothetical protein
MSPRDFRHVFPKIIDLRYLITVQKERIDSKCPKWATPPSPRAHNGCVFGGSGAVGLESSHHNASSRMCITMIPILSEIGQNHVLLHPTIASNLQIIVLTWEDGAFKHEKLCASWFARIGN